MLHTILDLLIVVGIPVFIVILTVFLLITITKKGNDVDWFFVGRAGLFGLILETLRPENISDGSPKGLKFLHKEIDINENYKEETLENGGWLCPKCGNLNDKHTGTCGCGEQRK
ncbi:MAG: hypothetical protein IJR59_05250 [Firmicutes bacterium]|nr:hypothetical protein [Bacillota bacterium]